MNYLAGLSKKIKFNESLSKHTTFKIGGAAEMWFEPEDVNNLREAVKIAKKRDIPISIIGRGSNILVSDKGIKGIVINLNAANFRKIEFRKKQVCCGAGVKISSLIKEALYHNLGGLEFLSGIPGTVGGAVIMNAGISYKIQNGKVKTKDVADLVKDVTVMGRNGKIHTIDKKKLVFGYRRSNLSKYIILSAHLKLFNKDKQKIKADIRKYQNYRKNTQDLSAVSLGCIFKNPSPDISAGLLIDLCGLKGKSIGDAFISTKHANFILNRGKAKAKDVLRLLSLVSESVKRKFDVDLETEMKIWQ